MKIYSEQVSEQSHDFGTFRFEVIGKKADGGSTSFEVAPSDSEVSPVSVNFPRQISRRGWLPNPRATPFDSDKSSLRRFEGRVYSENLKNLVFDDLEDLEEPLRSNLHRFFVNLWSYDLSTPCERKVLPISTIYSRSMSEGPSFARWLDGFRSYVIGINLNRRYFSTELAEKYCEEISNVEFPDLSVSDLYRPNSLMNWDAPVLDWKPIVSEPVSCNSECLDLFRNELRNLLNDEKFEIIEFPDWRDLVVQNSKKSFVSPGQKNVENWRIKPTCANTWGLTKICHIPREAKEKRAAVINDAGSAVRIRWIESCIKVILSLDKRSAMKYDPSTIRHKLNSFITNKTEGWGWRKRNTSPNWSYCRDFSKEGLTRPRIINRIILEELDARFGDRTSAFSNHHFFDEWMVVDENEDIFFTARGTGLGMFNAGVTLMQIVIEQVVQRISGIKPLGSLYLNDDATAFFSTEKESQIYATADRAFCVELDLAFKDKASFICKGHTVFCEQYALHGRRWFGKKDSYHANEALLPLCAVNASHARSICNMSNVQNVPKNILSVIFEYWGWVLFRNEWNRPMCTGGWWRSSVGGIDVTFVEKHRSDRLVPEETAAFDAYSQTSCEYVPWKKGKNKTRPFLRDRTTEKFCDAIGVPTYLDEASQFRPSSNSEETRRMWIAFEKKVQERFRRTCRTQKRCTWGEVWFLVQEREPCKDILPPKGMRCYHNVEVMANTADLDLVNPYRSTSLWKEFGEFVETEDNEYILETKPSEKIEFTGDQADGENPEPWKAAIKWREKHLPAGAMRHIWNMISLPKDTDLNDSYHNPLQAHYAIDRLTKSWATFSIAKEYLPKTKADLLMKRLKVLGKDLSVSEWIEFGRINPRDCQLQRRILKMTCGQTVIDYCLDILRRFPGVGGILNYISMGPKNDLRLFGFLRRWRYFHQRVKAVSEELPPLPSVDWYSKDELLAIFEMASEPCSEDESDGSVEIDESEVFPHFEETFEVGNEFIPDMCDLPEEEASYEEEREIWVGVDPDPESELVLDDFGATICEEEYLAEECDWL